MICAECGGPREPIVRKVKKPRIHCLKCYGRIWQRQKRNKGGFDRIHYVTNKNDIKDFVIKIERRNGLASLHEIFVEMITLYNESGLGGRPIDTLPVNKQLSHMWENLKRLSNT